MIAVRTRYWAVLCCIAASLLGPDRAVAQADGLLEKLAAKFGFEKAPLEIAGNLNSRDLARRLELPRLGGFPDLPSGLLPDTDDLLAWESAYQEGVIGGLAMAKPSPDLEPGSGFLQVWRKLPAADRYFVVFHRADLDLARTLEQSVRDLGYDTLMLDGGQEASEAGAVYVLAGSRLALDSMEARRLDIGLREVRFLGERLGRNAESLFELGTEPALARNEPEVFRKSTLGDEYNASTIEEIIVPGGIALGESVQLDLEVLGLRYADGELQVLAGDGVIYSLPSEQAATLKSLFDYAQRSEQAGTDAIVDIDGEGRVRISSALRDTDVGYDLMRIDTYPFRFVNRLPVTKSVIIDKRVELRETRPGSLDFTSAYEVRFLSADSMRIAQTRVALEYEVMPGMAPSFRHQWGRDLHRLDENLDYAGLGESTAAVAVYAGWIALFRMVARREVDFTDGRYEFMKIDKAGRTTPARF